MAKQPLDQKADITYPTPWGYKIIGEDLDSLYKVAQEILGHKKYSQRVGGRSKTGKYITLVLDTVVHSEEERNTLFSQLSSHPFVKATL